MECFYQTKYGKTTFVAMPRLSYIILNHPVMGKTTLLHQKSQQTHYYYRRVIKPYNAYQYLLLWFQQNIDKEKKLCHKKSLTRR